MGEPCLKKELLLGVTPFCFWAKNSPKTAFIVGESALFSSKTASPGGPKKAILSDMNSEIKRLTLMFS